MAWVLFGGVAAIGISYVCNEIYTGVADAIKPISSYFMERERLQQEEELDLLHQQHITRIKERRKNDDKIRSKYHLKERTKMMVNNDTDEICHLIFVSKNKTPEEALLATDNHRITLGARNTIELIDQELEYYHVILNVQNQNRILDGGIRVSEFNVKPVDISCW